jgi:hypothetical protein
LTIDKEYTGNSLGVLWEFFGHLLGVCLSIGLGLLGIYWSFTGDCTMYNAVNRPLEGEQ